MLGRDLTAHSLLIAALALSLSSGCDDKKEGDGAGKSADGEKSGDQGGDGGDEGSKDSGKAAAEGGGGGGGDGGDDGGGEDVALGAVKAVEVAAGDAAACALMDDGTVRCWGRNNRGEHGIAASDIDAATPVQVPGIADATHIWMGGDTGASGDMACVQTKDGALKCWGSKQLKPKTDGTTWTETPEEIAALKGIKDLALGGGTQYAVMADGTVQAWGSNAFNAVGIGKDKKDDVGLTPVPGVKDVTMMAAGQNNACALHSDGTVTCWGFSRNEQDPTKVEGLTDVVFIEAGNGNDETCAIKKDKKVYCFDAPMTIKEEDKLADATQISQRNHKCVLSGDGAVRCWGGNDRGQLGTGTEAPVGYSKDPVVELGKATQISTGSNFACAVIDDGNVKCWGYNNRGQLGDGTLIDRNKPVLVANLTAKTLPPAKDGADQAQESDVAMDWSGLPDKCKKPEGIKAENKYLGGEFTVASAYASSSGEGKYVNVGLATFRMDPKRMWDGPRGTQFKLNLDFGKVNLESKEAFPVDVGEYVFGLDNERKVRSSVQHKSGSATLMRLSRDGATPGTVTVDHIDDTWICGEMKLATKDSSFEGPWAARFPAKK